MSLFDVNYNMLRVQLLPVRLRKACTNAWLRACIYPVVYLHQLFMAWRSNNLYYLAHNSQVVYLEAVLNDTFDHVLKRIRIVDGAFKDPLYAYHIPEAKEIWLGLAGEAGTATYPVPQTLYTEEETTSMGNAFVVRVPAAVSFDANRMKALINNYRIAGKSIYQIVVY
jgi:hypothetical protein